MTVDEAIAWLEAHDYEVSRLENYEIPVWHVTGHGVSSQFQEDTIVTLADAEAHEERALQVTETAEETMERLAPAEPPAA